MEKKKILKGDIKEISKITSDIREIILQETESIKKEELLATVDSLEKSIEENKKLSKGKNILFIIISLLISVFIYTSFASQRMTTDILKTTHKQDSLLSEMSKLLSSSHTSYSNSTKDYEKLGHKYLNLANDYIIIIEKYNKQRISIELYKYKLHYIDSIYNIRFTKSDKIELLEGSKVDSALRLLPYYRNKLNYDKKKKRWEITIVK